MTSLEQHPDCTDGQAHLGDFGLTGVFKDPGYNPKLDTIRYMAPEWFLGKCFTESDVYSRYDFLLGTFLHREPPYYLMLLSHHEQVIMGILPYDDGDYDTIARRVGQGERPSCPRN